MNNKLLHRFVALIILHFSAASIICAEENDNDIQEIISTANSDSANELSQSRLDAFTYAKLKSEEKSLLAATFLEFIWPGAGSYYHDKNLLRPILFPSLRAGIVAATVILAINTNNEEVWLFTGSAAITIIQGISILSMVNTHNEYQEKLRKKYDLAFTGNGIQLSYKF